jgi:hypothetical protein
MAVHGLDHSDRLKIPGVGGSDPIPAEMGRRLASYWESGTPSEVHKGERLLPFCYCMKPKHSERP